MTAVLDALDTMDVEAVVESAIREFSFGSSRSKQSEQGLLGPSEIGGWRAAIAHTIIGTERLPEEGIQLAAFVGTAVGELGERAVLMYLATRIPDAQRHGPLTARLPHPGLNRPRTPGRDIGP